MKQTLLSKGSIGVATAMSMLLLAGCATAPAPDFGGRWQPVNRFARTTMEIPLYTSYVYQASPMDGTLKTMLERWAKDSGMTLDYRISSDYTLYGAVSSIETTNPQQAVVDLSAAYAGQGVLVSIVGSRIVVQSASSSTAAAGNADSASGS
jgi:hypothetical protein